MMTSFPLFSYPLTIAWVDDDKLFLKAISRMLQHDYALRIFNDANETLTFFEQYKPLLPNIPFLRGLSEHESFDMLEHMPVDLDTNLLAQLRKNTARSADISVIVIDYNMPNMNGIELCRKLKNLPMKKILLTGEVDHQYAVSAFNEGLIDRFIRKDSPTVVEEIQLHLKELSELYFIDNTRSLLAHLEVDYPLSVSDPVFSAFFKNWCREIKFVSIIY